MRIETDHLTCKTNGPGLYEITVPIRKFVQSVACRNGLLTIYCRHTSASLVVQENADPDVQRDLQAFFRRLCPDGDPLFVHTAEGPDDMPAHVKSALTATSLCIPIVNTQLVLGKWQGIFLFEHRRASHTRELVLNIVAN